MQALYQAALGLAFLVVGSFAYFAAREIARSFARKAPRPAVDSLPADPGPSVAYQVESLTLAPPSAPYALLDFYQEDPTVRVDPVASTPVPVSTDPVDPDDLDPSEVWDPADPTDDPSGDGADPADPERVFAWYDDRVCWGCSRCCTYKSFRLVDPGSEVSPADLESWEADRAYRAEHHGFSRIGLDDLGSTADAIAGGYTPPRTTPIERARLAGESKRRAWRDQCEACGEWTREHGEAYNRASFDPSALSDVDPDGEAF